MSLARAEKVEIALLALAATGAAVWSASFPRRVALADLLLCGAAMLLVQGLVRDLARLQRERAERATAVRAPVRCMCVESTLGVGAIVAGSVLLLAWTPIVFAVGRAAWPVGIFALGAFGFLTKDLVFDWRARRVRRDATHGAGV